MSEKIQEQTPIGGIVITRAFHLTYEQDVVVQKALFVIRASSKESDTEALVRLCQLYLKNSIGKKPW